LYPAGPVVFIGKGYAIAAIVIHPHGIIIDLNMAPDIPMMYRR
jgi:hypothetical protein